MSSYEMEKAESVTLRDVGSLFLLKEFWFFMIYVVGVTCVYGVYDQQFPIYYASLFPTESIGNQVFGYLNSFQVFLEAGMMFAAPFIVNKIGAKNSLILAGFLMGFRIIGSGLVVAFNWNIFDEAYSCIRTSYYAHCHLQIFGS